MYGFIFLILSFFLLVNFFHMFVVQHIPSAYASYMQGNLPNKVFLSDKFGNMWPVKLAKFESEWYFGEGWAKVAQDNSLEHRDFIVFQFDGQKIFYFQIIGNNSCDKKGVGSLKFVLDSEEMENDEGNGEAMAQESKLSGRGPWKFRRGRGGKLR